MDIYKAFETWNGLNDVKNKRMPVKLSFAVARNLSILAPVMRVVESQKLEIIRKYMDKDGDGNPIMEDDGGVKVTDPKALEKDLDTLLSEDAGIELRKVGVDAFDKCDEEKYDAFTPTEIAALGEMIIFEGEEAAEDD